MILSAILKFDYSAGDSPVEMAGCYKYLYDIEI